MNWDSLRRFYLRLTHASPERKACRELLKAAKKGDAEQYLALTSHYIGLVQAYYGNCLHEPAHNRVARTTQLFITLRQHLKYVERLSDYEYMLARALIESGLESGPVASTEPLVTRLRLLSPEVRFAFLATELGQWPVRWVALVLRLRPSRLHQLLAEARSELCGFSWESLTESERACLLTISACLDNCPNFKQNKALAQQVADYPRVAEIKAHWLELRPRLVEVRHRYLPDDAQKEEILSQILNGVAEAPMLRPRLVDRLVNSVHFSRGTQIKVS